MSQHAPIAITLGDPAGIGPEIIVRMAIARTPEQAPLLVIGDAAILQRAAARMGIKPAIEVLERLARLPDTGQGQSIYVLQPEAPLPGDLPIGRVDARAGAAAYAWVVHAIDLALAGEIGAVVTAPLNKAALAAAGIPYPGHTEILAERSGTRDFGMMLANSELCVMLVSIHLSLRDAIEAVTEANELRAIRLAARACRARGIAAPRIAVAGLNPHAGEGGLFGDEDARIIAPAIECARAEGLDASGPWPGDTVFMRARRGDFDVVVAQYHDQGLIPVKYPGIEDGINVTVGLPFVRTSVDHGTAFDIAGQGIADPASLIQAFRQADTLVRAATASV